VRAPASATPNTTPNPPPPGCSRYGWPPARRRRAALGQSRLSPGGPSGRFVTLASGTSRADALSINAEADVLGATMHAGEIITHDLAFRPQAYLVPTTGKILVNGVELMPRDGAAIHHETQLTITAIEDTQVVLVTLY
jgi:redox-sensitive bicupin YhaK (pirin superfamily)